MKWIKLSSAEAKALFGAASQMRDDFEDYAEETSEKRTPTAKRKDAKEQFSAYESGMDKLKSVFNTNKPT